jgi:ubiquitin-protein ligase
MTPRDRRLMADLHAMHELVSRSPEIDFQCEGDPPETYTVMFNVAGLGLDKTGLPALRTTHRCSIYLHRDYPRRAPVISWITPVYHPNLLGPERNGGVCIGSWSAGESLSDLVQRLADLVSFRTYNVSDPLDKNAAAWVRKSGIPRGADIAAWLTSGGSDPQGLEHPVHDEFAVVLRRAAA